MGMADHKECKHYEDCSYRNDIGVCPNWCAQFKHKDDVRVVRSQNCQYSEPCKPYNKVWCPKMGRYMKQDGFCSEGKVKEDD